MKIEDQSMCLTNRIRDMDDAISIMVRLKPGLAIDVKKVS
jgi:hypothetical protein